MQACLDTQGCVAHCMLGINHQQFLFLQEAPHIYTASIASRTGCHHSRSFISSKGHQQLCSPPRRSPQAVQSEAVYSVKQTSQSRLDAAQAVFAEAHVSEKAAASALKKCKTYRNWDLDSELRPTVQMCLDAIGSQELSLRLTGAPHILLTTPASYNDVLNYLASLGIDADRIQQKDPKLIARKLSDIQSTVSAIQQGLQLKDQLLPVFDISVVFAMKQSMWLRLCK